MSDFWYKCVREGAFVLMYVCKFRLILFSNNIDKVLYVSRQRRQNNEIIPKLVYDFLPI